MRMLDYALDMEVLKRAKKSIIKRLFHAGDISNLERELLERGIALQAEIDAELKEQKIA